MQGLRQLEASEIRRRDKILDKLQRFSARFEQKGESKAWAAEIEGETEAGSGWSSTEEVLGYMFLRMRSPAWFVVLDAESWALINRYGRHLARQTGREEWAEFPAGVAQLIANAAAVSLATDFSELV